MRITIVTDNNINEMIAMCTDIGEHTSLFRDLCYRRGVSMAEYMCLIMSTYMTNYMPLGDHPLSVEEHNRITTLYEGVTAVLGPEFSPTYEIYRLDKCDAMIGARVLDVNGSFDCFCSSMWDDLYADLESYYDEIYGVDAILNDRIPIHADLETVIEVVRHVAREIETSYLRWREDDTPECSVLFGTYHQNLLVLVD